MKKSKISAIILASTLSFGGITYAVAGNGNGMKNNQNCTNESGQVQNCKKQSGEMKNKQGSMKKGNRGGHKHQGMKGQKNQKMVFSQLDLTDSQKQEMKDIRTASRDANKESKSAYRAKMQTLMNSETFNVEAAQELINEQQVQQAEKRLTKMKEKYDMFQLLTDEQKTKFSELQLERQNNRANR